MNKYLFQAFSLSSLIILSACSSSSSENEDQNLVLSDFAQLDQNSSLSGAWDFSYTDDIFGRDTIYVFIDEDLSIRVYDYAGDEFDGEDDCYWGFNLSLTEKDNGGFYLMDDYGLESEIESISFSSNSISLTYRYTEGPYQYLQSARRINDIQENSLIEKECGNDVTDSTDSTIENDEPNTTPSAPSESNSDPVSDAQLIALAQGFWHVKRDPEEMSDFDTYFTLDSSFKGTIYDYQGYFGQNCYLSADLEIREKSNGFLELSYDGITIDLFNIFFKDESMYFSFVSNPQTIEDEGVVEIVKPESTLESDIRAALCP